ncbi:MAG: hypothetical protein HLUCCO16_21485 [Phormidium sp. OSCR]|nr:MAG: hypothetical protein HLUCCO16_21485 [Phormidium sp. OSCR]
MLGKFEPTPRFAHPSQEGKYLKNPLLGGAGVGYLK